MGAPRNIVGPQVMRIRNGKNMSQADLAVACQLAGWDVSRGVIANIEGRVRWVADSELLHLARALKISVQELFPGRMQKFFLHSKPSHGLDTEHDLMGSDAQQLEHRVAGAQSEWGRPV